MYDLFTDNIGKGIRIMKKKVTISLDEDIVEKLKDLAETSHRNVSQWITDKVIEAAKEEKLEKKRKG